MALPVYSSREVKVNWMGSELTGLAPDTFATFSYNSDNTDEVVGADGSLATSINPDLTGTCTLTFLQTSDANQALGLIQNAIKHGGILPRGTLAISDPSGSVLAILRNAYLKTPPEIVMGLTGQDRAWTFFVEELWFQSVPTELGKLVSDSDAARITALADTIRNA